MTSLRNRLLIGVCLTTCVILAGAALGCFALARSYLIADLDGSVERKARLMASLVEIEGDKIEMDFTDVDLREFESPEGGWFAEVYFDGRLEHRSPSLGEDEIDMTGVWQRPRWVALPGGSRGRGVMIRVDLEGEQVGSRIDVFVAADAAGVFGTTRFLAWLLLNVTWVTAAVLVCVVVAVVTRGLRPVEELSAAIAKVDASALGEALPTARLPRELVPIVEQVNAMMGRLRVAFERERGFCADVAHELRTPLAGLRATLDIARARTRTPAEYARAIEQCHAVTVQTQRLIERLLELSRLETGQVVVRPEPLDIHAMLRRVWEEAGNGDAPPPRIVVAWDLIDTPPLRADPVLTELILRNVLGNARAYVDPGGRITIACRAAPEGGVVVTVTNTGARVAPRDAERVFDRFWRGEAARSETGVHFGLGLALAQRAAQNMGGRIAVESSADGRFTATISWPPTPA